MLMYLSIGGLFAITGYLVARMLDGRKANKLVKASHFSREGGYK